MSLSQDQIRKVMDTLRALSIMLESLFNDDSAKNLEERHQTVLKNEGEARQHRRVIEEEIAKVGAILTNREEFLRLVDDIDEIADLAEGVGYRVISLVRTKLKVNRDLLKQIYVLSENVLTTVSKLRESLLAVTLNASTFSEKVKETEEWERKVDEIYRSLDLAILQSEMKIPSLLLSREIASMLEDIADKAEEASDTLRALSLAIL